MDNRIFNVNGRTKEQLEIAVKLFLLDEYGHSRKVVGWYYEETKGLVLTWFVGDKYKATPFTDRMGAPTNIEEKELVDLLWNWLNSEEAKKVKCEEMDADEDTDGTNKRGWRLYVDEYGHINNGGSLDNYSIGAFKPVFCWYGK